MKLQKETMDRFNSALSPCSILLTDGIHETKLINPKNGFCFANLEDIGELIHDLERIKKFVEDNTGVIL